MRIGISGKFKSLTPYPLPLFVRADIEGEYGHIQMDFPYGSYANNMDCEWRVTTPHDTVVLFTFDTFSLESCGSMCSCDYVQFEDVSTGQFIG